MIPAATGQIGRPMSERLIAAGYDLVVLSRDPEDARAVVPGALDYLAWQPGEPGPWFSAVEGADAVIGLAGAPYFRKWKSKEKFDRIGTGSRILANRGLVEAMRAATLRPRVVVSASARMVPRKALELGYVFQFDGLEPTLRDLLLP